MFLLLKIKLHFSESVKTFSKIETNDQTEHTNKIGSLQFLEIFSASYLRCLTYVIKQDQKSY